MEPLNIQAAEANDQPSSMQLLPLWPQPKQPDSFRTVPKGQMFADFSSQVPQRSAFWLLSAANIVTTPSSHLYCLYKVTVMQSSTEKPHQCFCDLELSGEPCLGLIGQL